jgi:hypothetical protein
MPYDSNEIHDVHDQAICKLALFCLVMLDSCSPVCSDWDLLASAKVDTSSGSKVRLHFICLEYHSERYQNTPRTQTGPYLHSYATLNSFR